MATSRRPEAQLDRLHRLARRERIELTPLETRLLGLFMLHAGKECSREFIFETVWGQDVKIDSGFLDVHINRLRAKIDFAPGTRMIQTVRGVGYKLTADG